MVLQVAEAFGVPPQMVISGLRPIPVDHDPVVKGKGRRCVAWCPGCGARVLARGSRAHCNRFARLHRRPGRPWAALTVRYDW